MKKLCILLIIFVLIFSCKKSDEFYERSFLLDWNFFRPKGRNSNFLPSSYSYVKSGVSHIMTETKFICIFAAIFM
ncbi:hypothetical protein E4O05_10205 [Treponema sp. OMZ 787]|uniref:hypothetical protein n=1 Tax=Treponema sp. OMZ 787 TaxID=2563669 RepID=UPI0020A3D127|nr:hypothetical protein [Treponema sp. OMZ 787]UTC61230.1 hypothetical protein E4O05_10205 [Treponema sp. OMZ 787]